MKLPTLNIDLPEWNEHDFDKIIKAEESAALIARGAGKSSDAFMNACRRLLAKVMTNGHARLCEEIGQPVDVRACTYLLFSSDEFAQRVSIDRSLLDCLLKPRYPLTKLSLMQLIRAFLERYDELADKQNLDLWCTFIRDQLSRLDSKKNTSDLNRYSKFGDVIFSRSGPAQVVNFAKSNGIDFDTALEKLGLNGFSDGRYIKLCRYQYYLETLTQIEVGENHPILKEVVKKDVVEAPTAEGNQLGHSIIEILIDRTAGRAISQAWQNTILTIAGDPRVPKSSANFQQWWAILGEKRIAFMRGWLSRFDLKLFLRVLEQSAKDGHINDMERMFESRKVFMEGLLESGLISESRLFLSGHAEHYLKRNYDPKELPEYATISSNQTSMIYLNIAGKAHMIEGSHSFKLKLFNRLPSSPRVDDYSVKSLSDDSLRSGIVHRYRREFNNEDGYRDLTHDIHLNWQYKALTFLKRQGVSIDPARVISRDRYRDYKAKHGIR